MFFLVPADRENSRRCHFSFVIGDFFRGGQWCRSGVRYYSLLGDTSDQTTWSIHVSPRWEYVREKNRTKILSSGRTRLEPIAIVILSVIMCSASIQVISESLQTTVEDVKMLRKYPSNSSEYVHPINMSVIPIAIMLTTIGKLLRWARNGGWNPVRLGLKLMLFFLCSRESSATLNALAQDHRNDVLSNSIALLCGILGKWHWLKRDEMTSDLLRKVSGRGRDWKTSFHRWFWRIRLALFSSRSISWLPGFVKRIVSVSISFSTWSERTSL